MSRRYTDHRGRRHHTPLAAVMAVLNDGKDSEEDGGDGGA